MRIIAGPGILIFLRHRVEDMSEVHFHDPLLLSPDRSLFTERFRLWVNLGIIGSVISVFGGERGQIASLTAPRAPLVAFSDRLIGSWSPKLVNCPLQGIKCVTRSKCGVGTGTGTAKIWCDLSIILLQTPLIYRLITTEGHKEPTNRYYWISSPLGAQTPCDNRLKKWS